MANLYLIPTTLGETNLSHILPTGNNEITCQIRHFIVENVRTARRFLRSIDSLFPIDECQFFTLDKHTVAEESALFLAPLQKGFDMGMISEAGCPAVADPGADIVALAQRKGIQVIPLVGPSSILLALMGSGFNGQSFAFTGYLPVDSHERSKALVRLENRVRNEGQTQLFIETPYRNHKMLSEILRVCRPDTMLCIAADITLKTEFIQTKSIAQWKKTVLPNLNKRPCIFLLGN